MEENLSGTEHETFFNDTIRSKIKSRSSIIQQWQSKRESQQLEEWHSKTIQNAQMRVWSPEAMCLHDDQLYTQVVRGTSPPPDSNHDPTYAPVRSTKTPDWHQLASNGVKHKRSKSISAANRIYENERVMCNGTKPTLPHIAFKERSVPCIASTSSSSQAREEPPKAKRLAMLRIDFKNEATCRLGDILQGYVELTVDRCIDISHMTITFYGEVSYKKNGIRRCNRFERQRQDLWRSMGRNSTLKIGYYVYEFYVGTRPDLPSSFYAKSGVIEALNYYCEVRIGEAQRDQEYRVEHIKRRRIYLKTPPSATIITPGLLYQADQLADLNNIHVRAPVCQRSIMQVKNLIDTSGCIVVTALVGNQQVRPGENIIYNLEVLNCYKTLRIYVSLVQYALIIRRDQPATSEQLTSCVKVKTRLFDRSTKNMIRHEIYRIKLGSMDSKEKQREWKSQSLWIPNRLVAPVSVERYYRNMRILSLGHYFIVTVLPRMGKEIEVHIPLVVRDRLLPCRLTLNNGTILSGAVSI